MPQGMRTGGPDRDTEQCARFDRYTPLTINRVAIYTTMKRDEKWQIPLKMREKNSDRDRWCDFYNDHGHMTNDYKGLKGQHRGSHQKRLLDQVPCTGCPARRGGTQAARMKGPPALASTTGWGLSLLSLEAAQASRPNLEATCGPCSTK